MKKIYLFLGLSLMLTSCSDNMESLNNDEKNPAVVPASTLFTSAERTLSDQMINSNVNRNIFRLLSQQWTETTYTDESNYDFVTRKISDNHWNELYAGVLADLYKAKEYVTAESIPANDPAFAEKTAIKNNKLAQIDILIVYTYQVLVDTFGDVPYTQALLGGANYLPKYDKAIDIYKDLITRLSNDVNQMDSSYAGFDNADVMYHGDMDNWMYFANSIKLKLGVNLLASGQESTIATNAITAAINDGLITSNADNAKVPYMSAVPNTNPIFNDLVNSGRHDFVVTNVVVDKMLPLNDPRFLIYTNGNPDGGIVGESNSFSGSTQVGDKIQEPDFSGTLLDAAEVEFLLAEAAERGVAAAGSAETHYNNAILASMDDWGVGAIDAAAYLAQPAVAYTTAAGTWQQKIGEQAWLGLYNRGFEAWTSYRRLNYPALVAPPTADAAAEGLVPVRMQYPIREQTLNPTNYNAAATAIGGDKLTTRLFWDAN